jgi:hypothetical protein
VVELLVLALVVLAALGLAADSASARHSTLRHHRRTALRHHPRPALRHHRQLALRHHRRLALRLADERSAPALWVSGGTLHWSATASSHEYIESRTSGGKTSYVLVAGTADTPPPVAGETVTYQVRARYQPHKWSNAVKVFYPHTKHTHEGGETEQREREEREAKERAEREAKETAEREAKEAAEREAAERAERERREREERELVGGEGPTAAVVGKAPVGPPSPSSGWHIAYGDAFGKPLSEDHTFEAREKGQGCCGNSNEVAVERKAQAHVGAEGLELICTLGTYTVEGVTHAAACGGGNTDAFFEFNYAGVGEWAVECFCRWPVDLGGADPGFWVYTGSQELDFFEGWGWNGLSWLTATAGVPVVVTPYHEHFLNGVTGALGFDPSAGFHRYTTLFSPRGGSNYLVSEYIDGAFRWSFEDTIASTTDGLILTNALRERVQPDVMTIRSIAMWQDGAHAGVGVHGGGIAPGTTVK